MQYNFKLGVLSCLLLTPSAVLVAFASPSYAQLSDITKVKTLAQAANPQGDVNRERFIQPPLNTQPLPPETQQQLPRIPVPEITPGETSEQIEVKKVEVKGSTIFSSEKLNSITQSVEGRTVSFGELQKVASNITQLYLNQGYLTSRAVLPDLKKITDGIVKIRVIEGSLEDVEIKGTRRLKPEFVRSRIIKAAGKPLSAAKLEDQLRLLKSNPLFENVEASLRAGTKEGQSILKVRVREAKQFNAAASFDNYSPPSVGSERLGISAVYRNLTGNGDEISGSYYRTLAGGSNIYELGYKVPLNADDGTLQLRASLNDNKVVRGDFKDLDIEGESQLYEISYRHPLIRSTREEFALSAGFTIQNGEFSSALIPSADDENRTRVIKLGQDYLKRDTKGAWAVRSQFSIGTSLLNATETSDSTPDGQFLSWLVQGQRVQQINDNNVLIAQLDLQLTPNPLLSSQQFVIGGGQSVRGFRQNIRSGDNGVRLSVEDRITLKKNASGSSVLQVAPFIDAGYIWNDDSNPTQLNQQFLAGVGVGVLWKPLPRMNLRLDYGVPLVNLDDREDNIQDDGLYFSLNYRI